MKKLVLALACLASFAFLASCKLETTSKDVQTYKYLGTVKGTITEKVTFSFTEGTYKDGVFTAAEEAVTDIGTPTKTEKLPVKYLLEYSDNVNANYVEYKFTFLDKDDNTIGTYYIDFTNDKYYYGINDITSGINGDITNAFTFKYTVTSESQSPSSKYIDGENYYGQTTRTTDVIFDISLSHN